MDEIQDEAFAKACEEIQKLQLEDSKLKDQWLELTDELLSYAGLPGHLHRIDVKIKQLKSLLVRAAEALEKGSFETHLQLVQQLRKAAE
jgi:hypothetical protein